MAELLPAALMLATAALPLRAVVYYERNRRP